MDTRKYTKYLVVIGPPADATKPIGPQVAAAMLADGATQLWPGVWLVDAPNGKADIAKLKVGPVAAGRAGIAWFPFVDDGEYGIGFPPGYERFTLPGTLDRVSPLDQFSLPLGMRR